MATEFYGETPISLTVSASPTPTASQFTVSDDTDLVANQFILVEVGGELERTRIESLPGSNVVNVNTGTYALSGAPDAPGEVRSTRSLITTSIENQKGVYNASDIADLKTVDCTYAPNGLKYIVDGFGLYKYESQSSAKPDNEIIVKPTTGSGRWHLLCPDGDGIWAYLEPDRAEVLPAVIDNLDFASISAGAIGTQTVTVSGAAAGDMVALGPPAAIDAGLMWSGFVSAADTVTIRLYNSTGSPIDPAAADWSVQVTKPNTAPSLTLRSIAIYNNLLTGGYAAGELETDVTTGGGYSDLVALLANTRARKELIADSSANALLKASSTANTEVLVHESSY